MNGVNKKALGNKIRTLRIENHWTMNDLAQFVGAGSKSTVNSWERGQSVPSMDKLNKLATLFQVSCDELINAGKVNYLAKLEELRKSKGITQRELSKETGMSFQSISFYERGEREPGVKALINLADYFNVSIDYLVGRSDKR